MTSDLRADVPNPHDSSILIQTHRRFIEALYAHENLLQAYQMQHTFATRLFEYVYEQSWPTVCYEMYQRSLHPTLRLRDTLIWFYLAANGWKNWHADCLDALVVQAQQGKRVVYPGGGSDISALLARGIPNLTIIDPQLPSQPRYYADGWEWLIKGNGISGGIGDRLMCPNVQLERIQYKEHGTFEATLADGSQKTLPLSTTVWAVRDVKDRPLGTYVFERRFTKQEDFKYSPERVMLLSFNELYFVELPSMFGGWGILPIYFDEQQQIFVKQLPKSVSKKTVCNMRMVSSINFATFNFIALGTCVN